MCVKTQIQTCAAASSMMLKNGVFEFLWVRKWVDKSCHTCRTHVESQHGEVSTKSKSQNTVTLI